MSNQIALVTGANSGLGFECAKELCIRDVSTVIVARRSTLLHKKANELESYVGGKTKIFSISADVGDPTDIQKIVKFLKEENLSVKWLINNAGSGRFGDISSYSYKDIEEVFRANLLGLILMSQHFIDEIESNSGILCNVMSTAALNYRAKETVYTASKWGARAFTEALRIELKGRSIRIMAVYPGGMNTPFWEKSKDYISDTSRFMSPSVVANRIISNMLDPEGCQVSDITINRL